MSNNKPVIAILNDKKIVVSFATFNDEAQFDRMLVECKKRNESVRLMEKNIARQHMIDETPVN